MRILVAVEPVDFRCGIDGLVRLCREQLAADPFTGAVYVFRNRRRTALKLIVYDGQGFWLCHKRLSSGCFKDWPVSKDETSGVVLKAHELVVLLMAGNPTGIRTAPDWRPLTEE
jgi:transposase